MVLRRGVGGTIAAALVFSSLVVANLAIVASSSDRMRLSSQANAEGLLYDSSLVASGNQALSLLGKVQTLLTERVFECSSAVSEVSAWTLSSSIVHRDMTVLERMTVAGGSTQMDNMSILEPFNGSREGILNLRLSVNDTGAVPASAVTLHKSETHYLNIPVEFPSMVSFCISSASQVVSMLNATGVPYCSLGAVISVLNQTTRNLALTATSLGMGYSVNVRLATAAGCTVDYVINVAESGIAGPTGPFSVRMEQSGSAFVRVHP